MTFPGVSRRPAPDYCAVQIGFPGKPAQCEQALRACTWGQVGQNLGECCPWGATSTPRAAPLAGPARGAKNSLLRRRPDATPAVRPPCARTAGCLARGGVGGTRRLDSRRRVPLAQPPVSAARGSRVAARLALGAGRRSSSRRLGTVLEPPFEGLALRGSQERPPRPLRVCLWEGCIQPGGLQSRGPPSLSREFELGARRDPDERAGTHGHSRV